MKNTKRLFTTGVPVHGKDLAGREKEKESIKRLLKHGQSVILHGPRRIGKTSLALSVLDELQKEGFFVGHIDIFATATLRLLSQRLTETTLENKRLSRVVRSIRDGVHRAFSKIEVKQTIHDFEWILKFADQNTDDEDLFSDALDFPEKFARKHKTAMIMFVDEIGDIDKFDGESLIKLMRSKYQLHSNVTYLFAGSHASVIQNIFVDHSGPFYRFGQLTPLGIIERDIFKKFIKRKFSKVDLCPTDEALDLLLDITNGHPYYTQLLCREMYFYSLSQKSPLNSEVVKIALNEAMLIEDIYFTKIWEEISKNSSQIRILHDIVIEKYSLYNQTNNKKINVPRTLAQLVNKGIITKRGKGKYHLADPLFAQFLKNKLE